MEAIISSVCSAESMRGREVLHHVHEVETCIVMHIIVVIISSDELLFLGLVRWSNAFWPQVWIVTILVTQLRRFQFAFLVVAHWQVLILLIEMALKAMCIHHVHVLLKESLNFSFIGLYIVNHGSVARVDETTLFTLMVFTFL